MRIKYLCLACDTEFSEYEAEHKNGWLICPSCGYDELEEVEIPDNPVGAVEE